MTSAYLGRDEDLIQFTAQGPSKQRAKEASAKLMAMSKHCVSSTLYFIKIINQCTDMSDVCYSDPLMRTSGHRGASMQAEGEDPRKREPHPLLWLTSAAREGAVP